MVLRKHSKSKMTVFNLTWPIFIEMLLLMMLGSVDTLMLSRYSDNAVAAVGVSNQLIMMVNILFGLLATGTSVLIAQNLGAGNKNEASKIATVSLALNLVIGIILSLALYLGSGMILRIMGIRQELMGFGTDYLKIVGGFMFLQAILMTCTAIVRSHGFTKASMLITLLMNIIHVILDYMFIFGPFGIPVLGVRGVAFSTNVCKVLGLIIILYIVFKKVDRNISIKLLNPFPGKIVSNLMKIGIPTAGEQLSYNLSQLTITYFMNFLGNEALVTKAYVQNIVMFAALFAISIGQGTEILVAHLVGADKKEKAYETCLRSLRSGFLISAAIAFVFAAFRLQLLSLFTENPHIVAQGAMVLVIDVILEPGRSFNVIVINCLRASGDVKFPVYMGILSMWGISVTMSYFLGIYMGLGLAGMWAAFALDEWFRGIFMLWRWRTKKWVNMAFVTKKQLKCQSV
ncbi:MAG: MATE family efflux transporter [Clostridiaceae bacterium]